MSSGLTMHRSPRRVCSTGATGAAISKSRICSPLLTACLSDNFWSLARFGRVDYEYKRDGFALPKEPPPQVMLGDNCRAIVAGWKLRPGVKLESVTLETLSQDVTIGLMGVSVMNPGS